MSKDHPLIDEVFDEAIRRRSGEDRRAYLDEVCGDDAGFRQRVERLLEAATEAGDFLESPAAESFPSVNEAQIEKPGTLIGPYKLLELIGEGGFGNVYLAEQQEPVRRKVALKIIKLGMDTKAVIARFEAERQAVALMDHPNIAKVLDAGATETGRPYFVMELVRGVPITEYCDAHNLPTRARVQLFVDVCRAVQHAHQKGIIHRDLKPSNVLVTQQDAHPVPKIIDFGVAKATQQRLTEKTLFTEHRQLVGTPEYMSPEQATFCESDVDTRSDIYSLGVLLYELLVGATPFDGTTLRQRGYDEICRVIRESEPPTPSKRLSTIGSAAATDISKHRRVESAALRKLLRGDLDWIVMKCLEKQRTRRYETAHSLARDVERHLADEPVQARPPSAGYQLKKFIRKHRGPVVAGCAVGVALILGLLLSTIGFLRAERERQVAIAERDRAEKNLSLAIGLVDDVIDPATERLAHVPFTQETQQEFLERACEFYEQIIQQTGGEEEPRRKLGRAYHHLGRLFWSRSKDAEPPLRCSIEILTDLTKDFPNSANQVELANAYYWLGGWLWSDLRLQESVAAHQESVAIMEQLLESAPRATYAYNELAIKQIGLGHSLARAGQLHESEKDFRAALAAAEPLRRFTRVRSRTGCGALLIQLARYDEAEGLLQEALEIAEQGGAGILPETASGWASNFKSIALCHQLIGVQRLCTRRFDEAHKQLGTAIRAFEDLSDAYPPPLRVDYWLGSWYHDLAEVQTAMGRLDEAEDSRRRSLATWESVSAAVPAEFQHGKSLAHYRLGELLHHTGRLDEAVEEFASARALMEQVAERQPECPYSNWQLICLLANCPDQSLREPQRAVELARRVTSSSDGPSWRNLALAHYRSGEWSAAREAIQRSMDLRQGGDAIDGLLLAMALWELEQKEEAQKKYAEARVEIAAGQPIFYEYLGVLAIERLQKEAEELLGGVAKDDLEDEES